jgi:hypothetical protein
MTTAIEEKPVVRIKTPVRYADRDNERKYLYHHAKIFAITHEQQARYEPAIESAGDNPFVMKGVAQGLKAEGAFLTGKMAYVRTSSHDTPEIMEQDYDHLGNCLEQREFYTECKYSFSDSWEKNLQWRAIYDHHAKTILHLSTREHPCVMHVRFGTFKKSELNGTAENIITEDTAMPEFFGTKLLSMDFLNKYGTISVRSYYDNGWHRIPQEKIDFLSQNIPGIISADRAFDDEMTAFRPVLLKVKETFEMGKQQIKNPTYPAYPHCKL